MQLQSTGLYKMTVRTASANSANTNPLDSGDRSYLLCPPVSISLNKDGTMADHGIIAIECFQSIILHHDTTPLQQVEHGRVSVGHQPETSAKLQTSQKPMRLAISLTILYRGIIQKLITSHPSNLDALRAKKISLGKHSKRFWDLGSTWLSESFPSPITNQLANIPPFHSILVVDKVHLN